MRLMSVNDDAHASKSSHYKTDYLYVGQTTRKDTTTLITFFYLALLNPFNDSTQPQFSQIIWQDELLQCDLPMTSALLKHMQHSIITVQ